MRKDALEIIRAVARRARLALRLDHHQRLVPDRGSRAEADRHRHRSDQRVAQLPRRAPGQRPQAARPVQAHLAHRAVDDRARRQRADEQHHHERQPRGRRADRAARPLVGRVGDVHALLRAARRQPRPPVSARAPGDACSRCSTSSPRSSSRMPGVVANTQWYFDMIPTYVVGHGDRRLHRRQEDAAHLAGRHGAALRRAARRCRTTPSTTIARSRR